MEEWAVHNVSVRLSVHIVFFYGREALAGRWGAQCLSEKFRSFQLEALGVKMSEHSEERKKRWCTEKTLYGHSGEKPWMEKGG